MLHLEFDKETSKSNKCRQTQQQIDPNRDRRIAADKYRFSREVRIEVDEGQIRQTAADRSGRQTAADSRQSSRFRQTTADSYKQQQIQTADRTADSDSGEQNHPDKQGITRQYPMQNQTKSDETR
ncbi:hypothetical protein Tco_0247973 [Tanacetum coccineum]